MFFTQNDIWNGGFYELAIEVSNTSDELLGSALQAIWTHPTLQGCYVDRTKEPDEQTRVSPIQTSLESGLHLYGIAQLPNGQRITCGTVLVREEEGSDWLDLYMPMAALAQGYDVGGYPFDEDKRSPAHWQTSVDTWLAEIGVYVFSKTRYQLGLVGFEVSGVAYAQDMVKTGIPQERYIGYLWPSNGIVEYFPRTKYK